MAYQLVICNGPEKGRTIELPAGKTLMVGRGEDCDVQLADPRASRVHCKLQVADDGIVLTDAGSTWGIGGSNGAPVKERTATEGGGRDRAGRNATASRLGNRNTAARSRAGPEG